ncbi:MAG: hypothetical protein GY940_29445 [bacterium]|nr:hypothetical protein [bacterium]
MKASIARIIYRLGVINHRVEFLVILTWMLYCPSKESDFYFLSTAGLVCFFSLRNIYFMKTWGGSPFNFSLPVTGVVLLLTIFFSTSHLNSILFFGDILLVFCYFTLFYNDRGKEADLFRLIAYIISAFSLLNLVGYFVPLPFWQAGQAPIFFASAIHEGIISGMGVLILFCYLLKGSGEDKDEDNDEVNDGDKKERLRFIILIILNTAAVFVSQSKAAYLGTVGFTMLLLLLKKKKWIPYLGLFVILTFIIPNPIRSMVYRSLTKDPYAANRIQIWKMSLDVFADYPLMGVGLDNFPEVSNRYNFKQTNGPANYFKVPRNTHNDYLKLLVEAGIPGLAIILLLLWWLAVKLFSSSLFNISKILILYLLFQAFLFNILFTTFFFFIFVFLLKNQLEGEVTFRSFSVPLKFSLSCLLLIVFAACYLFPALANGLMKRSAASAHPVEAYNLLNTAGRLNPLDSNSYYLKAASLYRYFRQTSDLESFSSALLQIKQAQRLRPHFTGAYLLEATIYMELLNKNVKYTNLGDEIIGALEKAEAHEPFNPFIKLTKARIYMTFDKKEKAGEEARKAIGLEPEFVAALDFLHRQFNDFPDEAAFRNKIETILKKAKEWNPEPGHYLHRLWQMPGEGKEEKTEGGKVGR